MLKKIINELKILAIVLLIFFSWFWYDYFKYQNDWILTTWKVEFVKQTYWKVKHKNVVVSYNYNDTKYVEMNKWFSKYINISDINVWDEAKIYINKENPKEFLLSWNYNYLWFGGLWYLIYFLYAIFKKDKKHEDWEDIKSETNT